MCKLRTFCQYDVKLFFFLRERHREMETDHAPQSSSRKLFVHLLLGDGKHLLKIAMDGCLSTLSRSKVLNWLKLT